MVKQSCNRLSKRSSRNNDQALEDIRVAADESTISSISKKREEVLLNLLKRPWFRRIWVLQEVALTRDILIMCGSVEINGYTFCSGLKNLELSFKDDSDLQSLITSTTYIIRGAIFRRRFALGTSSGLSLSELIGIYHAHEATLFHDKVYALLSMSSDGLDEASLSPDYTIPWKTFLQRLIGFILSKEACVESWEEREIIVIKSKGYTLGYVSAAYLPKYNRQDLEIVFNDTHRSLEYKKEYGSRWTLQGPAKYVQDRDIICFLQGASKPTIIRPCKDHFAVIVIAVTPVKIDRRQHTIYADDQDPIAKEESIQHDFLLVWNWERHPEIWQDRAGYETSAEINTLLPGYLETASVRAAKSYDVILALKDSKEYEEAANRFRKIAQVEVAQGKENLHALAHMDDIALGYRDQNQREKAKNLFLLVIEMRKRAQGIHHQDTVSSIANLASVYLAEFPNVTKPRTRDLVRRPVLINQINDEVQITEENLVYAIRAFPERLLSLLFDLKKECVRVARMCVFIGGLIHREKMNFLLDRCGDEEVKIIEKVVKEIARDKTNVMQLFWDWRDDEVEISEEMVGGVVDGWLKMMNLLLHWYDVEVKKVKLEIEAVLVGGYKRKMELFLDRRGEETKIIGDVMAAAAISGYTDVVELILYPLDSDAEIRKEIDEAVAGSRHKIVRELLLDQRERRV